MSDPAAPYQHLAEETHNSRLIIEMSSRSLIRYNNVIRGLAIAELVLAIVCVILGTFAFGFGISGNGRSPVNADFTPVWLGILFIVASSLGVGASRVPSGLRCPLIAYFVLLIIGIVLTPILIGFTSFWTSVSNYYCSNDGGTLCSFVTLNVFLLIFGITEMILSIVSTAFLCYNWNCCSCCGRCCGCEDFEAPKVNVF